MNYEAHSQFQLTEYINLATPDADLSGSAIASAHFEKQSVNVIMYLLLRGVSVSGPIRSIPTWLHI